MTGWNSQKGNGKYALQFETDNRDLYKLVEKACQLAMDQEELAKLRNENRFLRNELDGAYFKIAHPEAENAELKMAVEG